MRIDNDRTLKQHVRHVVDQRIRSSHCDNELELKFNDLLELHEKTQHLIELEQSSELVCSQKIPLTIGLSSCGRWHRCVAFDVLQSTVAYR
jgi:hypothetical protein